MFGFKIVSTITVSDHADKINPGDALYVSDDDERFATEPAAHSAAEDILTGLDGGAAFRESLKSARIIVVSRS